MFTRETLIHYMSYTNSDTRVQQTVTINRVNRHRW